MEMDEPPRCLGLKMSTWSPFNPGSSISLASTVDSMYVNSSDNNNNTLAYVTNNIINV